jgi:SAM-dependent methyltransferase
MFAPPARELREEILDLPQLDPAALRANLEDLSRLHRLLGRAGMAEWKARIAAWPRQRPFRMLDVGAGSGAFLRTILDLCRRRGVRSFLVGVDRSRPVLQFARSALVSSPGIHLVQADAGALPFAPRSFDFVVCSLLLHHLPGERWESFLRQIGALATEQALVSDLRRGRLEYWLTRAFTRLLTHAPMTRHDGPLSVLRGLTLAEARELAGRADWNPRLVRRSFPLRYLMRHPGAR